MTTPAPARPSSTVLIVRDGSSGLEVFMVGRERQVDFASGVLVFPGGKVDPDDDSAAWPHLAPSAAPSHEYWIAAVRETFEEIYVSKILSKAIHRHFIVCSSFNVGFSDETCNHIVFNISER